MLLFTDGKANMGISKAYVKFLYGIDHSMLIANGREGIRNAVKGMLGQIDAVCSVFTFGYGDDIDSSYLTSISDVLFILPWY